MTAMFPHNGVHYQNVLNDSQDSHDDDVRLVFELGNWTVVHDFLFQAGGAEVATKHLAKDVLGGAKVAYIAGNKEVARALGLSDTARPLLPPVVFNEKTFRGATPLYPDILKSLPVLEGNVVASSYAFAHHVRCTGIKIVYCHSPMRQIWSGYDAYKQHASKLTRGALVLSSRRLRRQDRRAAATADLYVATGQTVADRLGQYYGIDDVPVVPPPVNTKIFTPRHGDAAREAFVWVGRIIEPYKRLGLVIEAFRGMPQRQLIVAGDGPDREALSRTAPSNVRFVGWKEPHEVAELFRSAQAVIFASTDDFGLVPVEAMSCGTSVIALRSGGAAETVMHGFSGLFFEHPTADAVRDAVRAHQEVSWSSDEIAAAASRYSLNQFVRSMQTIIATAENQSPQGMEAHP